MNSLEDVDPADAGQAYCDKKFWQKSVAVLSGVAMNFLIAYVMFFGVIVAEGYLKPHPTAYRSPPPRWIRSFSSLTTGLRARRRRRACSAETASSSSMAARSPSGTRRHRPSRPTRARPSR